MSEKNLGDYNTNDFFWKDFTNLPENPYKLDITLSGFNCLFIFLTKQTDFSRDDYPLPFGYMSSLIRMNAGKATILIQNVGAYNSDNFKGYDLICFYPMVALFDQ